MDSQQPGQPSPTPVISPQSEDLLRQLATASLAPLADLQQNINFTLEQLVEWMASRRNRRAIANLVNVYDAQSQLMVCQQRVLAIARLVQIACDVDARPEVVRRACADLLKIRLIDPYKEDERAHDRGAAPLRELTFKELHAMAMGAPDPRRP